MFASGVAGRHGMRGRRSLVVLRDHCGLKEMSEPRHCSVMCCSALIQRFCPAGSGWWNKWPKKEGQSSFVFTWGALRPSQNVCVKLQRAPICSTTLKFKTCSRRMLR